MKKAFSLSFFVIGMIALASIAITNSRIERREQLNASEGSEYTEPASPPASSKDDSKKSGDSKSSDKVLTVKFLDKNLAMSDRLDAWLKLQRQNPPPFNSLVQIATSPNPYEGKRFKAHSIEERHYRREEGLRIMALQSLEKLSSEDPSSLSFIETIARNAASPAVRSIAGKMYEFAKSGRSYSSLFEQAIMELKIPQ